MGVLTWNYKSNRERWGNSAGLLQSLQPKRQANSWNCYIPSSSRGGQFILQQDPMLLFRKPASLPLRVSGLACTFLPRPRNQPWFKFEADKRNNLDLPFLPISGPVSCQSAARADREAPSGGKRVDQKEKGTWGCRGQAASIGKISHRTGFQSQGDPRDVSWQNRSKSKAHAADYQAIWAVLKEQASANVGS